MLTLVDLRTATGRADRRVRTYVAQERALAGLAGPSARAPISEKIDRVWLFLALRHRSDFWLSAPEDEIPFYKYTRII